MSSEESYWVPSTSSSNTSLYLHLPEPSTLHTSDYLVSTPSLKRAASLDPEQSHTSRKRIKGDSELMMDNQQVSQSTPVIDGQALVDDLAQELQCGCCTELVYKPVIVTPCEHFFCGSCCTLWVQNGGTNCPACRGVSTAVTPSRTIQALVDVLLRAAPHRQRTERERQQADEVYPTLRSLKIPVPREPSPEPTIPVTNEFVRPCPHCAPNNSFGWICPLPIPDPVTDPEHAFRLDDGSPPGHGFCGNCEVILALHAPSTSKCDFCQVSFCGINVLGRCAASSLLGQHPHGMSDVADLIQSAEVYDCFDGNTVEVEIMLDYMTSRQLSPRHVYRQIVEHLLAQPTGFQPLFDLDLFTDIHGVAGGIDPNPSAPRQKICRLCASEILLHGIRDWWIRERKKAVREGWLSERSNCPEGRECRNDDLAHNREFNHIIVPPESEPVYQPDPPYSTSQPGPAANSSSNNSETNSRASSPRPRPTQTALPSLAELGIPTRSTYSYMPILTHPNSESTQGESSSFLSSTIFTAPTVPDTMNYIHAPSSDFDAEPSSSQSQRSVEAQLISPMHSGYEADICSDISRIPARDDPDIDSEVRVPFEYTQVLRQAMRRVEEEHDIISIRRAMNAGVSSTGVMDVDHHMEGVLPALPSSSSNAVGLPPQLEVE